MTEKTTSGGQSPQSSVTKNPLVKVGRGITATLATGRVRFLLRLDRWGRQRQTLGGYYRACAVFSSDGGECRRMPA